MARNRLITKLFNSTLGEINDLSGAGLEAAYKSVSASLRGRRSQFIKHGHLKGFKQSFQKGIPTKSSFETPGAMRSFVKEGLAYLRGSGSTWSGYEEQMSERRRKYEQTSGRKFESEEEFDQMGNFMDEMELRLGDSFKHQSSFIRDMFDESQRLNLDPQQLMKNFEYWRDHLDDLKAMDPIEGRNRALRPSDYLKKANLESITKYYQNRAETVEPSKVREISSDARKPSRGTKARAAREARKAKNGR